MQCAFVADLGREEFVCATLLLTNKHDPEKLSNGAVVGCTIGETVACNYQLGQFIVAVLANAYHDTIWR